MKALIVIDDYVYINNGIYYILPDIEVLLNRYLLAFESIRVLARCNNIDDLSKYNKVSEARIEIIPLPFVRGLRQVVNNYDYIKKIGKEALKGIDRAILRLPSTISFFISTLIEKLNIPYAVEVVFDPYDACVSSKTIIDKLLWYISYKKQAKICNNAVGVACVTKYYLQKRYFSKKNNSFTENYSSVELHKSFYESPRKYKNKATYVIFHSALQIVFNGRKGHKSLIEAIKILSDKGFNVIVNFAGDDYDNGVNKLKEYAKALGVVNCINFVGFLSKEDVKKYLCNSDLFVLPTLAEGLPRVILEAMAVGIPCVSTNVSGIPELINNDFLVSYSDSLSLAECILRLISDKYVYEKESFNNFKTSLEYDSNFLNNKRKNFYENLISV